MNYGLAYRVSGNAAYGSEGVKYLNGLLRDRNTIGDGPAAPPPSPSTPATSRATSAPASPSAATGSTARPA